MNTTSAYRLATPPDCTRLPDFGGLSFFDAVAFSLGNPVVKHATRDHDPKAGTTAGTIYWLCLSARPLTAQDLMTLQSEALYHPAGYGFFGLTESRNANQWIYHWTCTQNAD